MGEAERGEAAPRQAVTYFCSHEHRSVVTFAVDAVVPESWDCPKCGLPIDNYAPALSVYIDEQDRLVHRVCPGWKVTVVKDDDD